MRKIALASVAVALIFSLKSCGEPYEPAEEAVDSFLEEVQEKEGFDALKYLHPSFRDNLAKDLKLPVQFTELKPSEALACLLSTMGANMDDYEIKGGKMIGESTAIIKARVVDKDGIEKLFNFVLIKEDDRWLIADISPYTPDMKK